MMKAVDLFCGCGGLSLGFQKAGYEILAAFDNWDEVVTVYHNNFDHPVIKQDLSDVEATVEGIKKFNPEMIIGGPPCQDFSSAGKRNEDNGRGDLTVSYAKIVAAIKPEWFVMENVDRILKTGKLVEARKIFKECGYGLTETVLNASFCGVPQRRKRFIMIGHLGEKDGFMADVLEKRQASKEMTIADYFGKQIDIKYYYRHPRSYARRGIFSVDEPSPTIRGVNRPMPAGYKLHPTDPVTSLEGIRPLTTQERSMIQTFPKDFKFIGTKTGMEQMIGNAVPVNLAKFVGDSIMVYLGIDNPISVVDIQKEFPSEIVNHKSDIIDSDLDFGKSVLVSLVKSDNVDMFLDGSARIYYTGKKFPSTVALNKLFYFMPYVKKQGVRDLYLIKIARVGSKHEVHPDADKNDLRLVFEIEFNKQLFDEYKPIRLKIWDTFTDTSLGELISCRKNATT
jgi:DNA (cytosine-5)-methyltransferase 1